MEINRVGNFDLTTEEKKELVLRAVEDCKTLMLQFAVLNWNVDRALNAMLWLMSGLMFDNDIDEEDLRVFFAAVKENVKLFEYLPKDEEDA